jgi:hypothetical protein
VQNFALGGGILNTDSEKPQAPRSMGALCLLSAEYSLFYDEKPFEGGLQPPHIIYFRVERGQFLVYIL